MLAPQVTVYPEVLSALHIRPLGYASMPLGTIAPLPVRSENKISANGGRPPLDGGRPPPWAAPLSHRLVTLVATAQ